MQLRRSMLLMGVCLLLVIFCGLLSYLFITPWFDKPPMPTASSDQRSSTYCASRTCHYLASYEFSGTYNDLLLFYKQKGFDCKEVDSQSIEALLPELKETYWQCVGKATPRGDVVVGFQHVDTATPGKHIDVKVHMSWNPVL